MEQFIKRQSRWFIVSGSVLLLTSIAYVDFVTPPDLSMALFYLLPVALVTWSVGRREGYMMACIGAATEFMVELYSSNYHDKSFAYWNGLARLGFFLFSVPVLSSWRTMGERLTKMVEERTVELRAEIVERQRAESAVRDLARQLSAVEDAERRRFAYDLHDGMGQMLSLLKMNLESASASPKSAAPERIADSIRMVDSLIKQARSLTFDLHPAMLDDLGLLATLRGYARDFGQRVGMDVTVTEHGVGRTLSTTMAHYLFRSVKELLNNAARHGKANEIVIAVHWEPQRIRLVVDDDGSGFEPAALPLRQGPRGLGLLGIGERLQSLGGGINIESSPGQGTRVILEAPLEPIPLGETSSRIAAPVDLSATAGRSAAATASPVAARSDAAGPESSEREATERKLIPTA